MNYDGSTSFSWKEILSLTDDYCQVNSLLAQPDICLDDNFILPKSLHLCMIRYDGAMSNAREDEEQLDEKNLQEHAREEREAGAQGWKESSFGSDRQNL